MEIIKIHYKISKPVKAWKEIKTEAGLMRRFIVRGRLKGYYNKAFSISHCQVNEKPYAFFVVAPECLKEKMFVDDVIINPEIVECKPYKQITDKVKIPNIIEYQEPCLSFPFRKPKAVKRYDVIKVKYQIHGLLGGFRTIKAELKGIASEIFQHECDHIQGKNIYFTSESPTKWWELIGTERSLGGTSLDDPEYLKLKRSKEVATT